MTAERVSHPQTRCASTQPVGFTLTVRSFEFRGTRALVTLLHLVTLPAILTRVWHTVTFCNAPKGRIKINDLLASSHMHNSFPTISSYELKHVQYCGKAVVRRNKHTFTTYKSRETSTTATNWIIQIRTYAETEMHIVNGCVCGGGGGRSLWEGIETEGEGG